MSGLVSGNPQCDTIPRVPVIKRSSSAVRTVGWPVLPRFLPSIFRTKVGLLCGTTYYLYLVAFNKIGSSPASHPLHARTQGRPPGVPIESSFIFPNSTSVVLRFHVWPDNGCPILYFILQYRRATDSQWILVSNALKPQRKTSITGLTPATHYIVKVEAYNIAGSSMEEFSFITLTKDGDVPPPDLMKQGDNGEPLYTDIKIVLPLTIIVLILLSSGTSTVICLKSRQNNITSREQLDNQHNAEAQRERYYATIHKAALQAGEKVPETSEDISPYATFQLSGQATLPQNTMLHSFMYREHAMTEGCASPPPAISMQRNSPYYNVQKSETTKSHGRRKASRKANIDSEDSESDPDHLLSSRTESSIQLDLNQKHKIFSDFIYHGHSSTSSDLSPMSEQKSFPRRGRSRWSSTKQILPSLSIAETTFTEHPTPREQTERTELSEAECDIDTLKKLKLGLRSSLWSKPSETGQSSDYSIAV
ncbi:Fibronectin type III domain [Popillia japonica]|uniref:Fibronectin type III domain n=1 Tax=Popillia japonica TaxID=7064 RepID=A0AAW1IF79_POPJA